MKKGIPGAAGYCDKCGRAVVAHFIKGKGDFGKFCAKHTVEYLQKNYPNSNLISHYKEMEKKS